MMSLIIGQQGKVLFTTYLPILIGSQIILYLKFSDIFWFFPALVDGN